MYHLQLFKRRHLDERKTLTKVSTRKPLTNIPQTKAHTSERENQEKSMRTGKLVKGSDTAETSKKPLAHKDIKGLEATISHYEYDLGRGQAQPEETLAPEDDPSHPGVMGTEEAEMATAPVANDAPPASAVPDPLTSPLGEEQTHSMEVDDGGNRQPPASPISHREDEI